MYLPHHSGRIIVPLMLGVPKGLDGDCNYYNRYYNSEDLEVVSWTI